MTENKKEQNKKPLCVAGWTDYEDDDYPFCEDISDEVFDAVIKEVREHGYLFGGDSHHNFIGCCPVLSNGTKAGFTWRDWGYIIAVAYDLRGANGDYDHMCGYMDLLIKPEAIKRPPDGVDLSLIEK